MNLSIFKDILFEQRTQCAVCQKELGAPLIELPSLPLTDIYVEEVPKEKTGYVDQNFHFCNECGHGQLSNIISQKILYGQSYSLRTSKNTWGARKWNDFLFSFVNKITRNTKFKTILEIGCNDVYLLRCLKSRADKLVGIDPVLKGVEEEFSDDKIIAIGDFFENVDLRQYMPSGDTLVLTSHLLEHVEDPRVMMEKLLETSADNTLFIFAFPGFDVLIEDSRFDQVYHHHLHYFSLHSFTYLLNELGCELIDHDVNPHYWGSLLVAFRKTSKKNPLPEKVTPEKVLESYDLFKNRMDTTNKLLKSLEGERLFGYGAGLQLPVLGYHLDNDFSSLICIIDDDRNKEGLFYLNLPVPIRSSEGIDIKEAIVVVTAINFSRGILSSIIPLNPKRIILPINSI